MIMLLNQQDEINNLTNENNETVFSENNKTNHRKTESEELIDEEY